jgi:phosphoribosyl-ATP pyrophosphohydrolase
MDSQNLNKLEQLFIHLELGVECWYRHRAKEARMTASIWNWVLAIVGTVASTAGFVFSWMAWVQAKGAKKAANEAARSVKSKDAAYEFAKLAEDAKELLAAVQYQRADRAIEAVNDLVHLLSVAIARRVDFLPVDVELKVAIKQLSAVSE